MEDQTVAHGSTWIVVGMAFVSMVGGIFSGLFAYLNSKLKMKLEQEKIKTDAKLTNMQREIEDCAKDREKLKEMETAYETYKGKMKEELQVLRNGQLEIIAAIKSVQTATIQQPQTPDSVKDSITIQRNELDKTAKEVSEVIDTNLHIRSSGEDDAQDNS